MVTKYRRQQLKLNPELYESKIDNTYEDYVQTAKDISKIIPLEKWDAVGVAQYINQLANHAQSTYTDGWTACNCKRELYLLKCFIEDLLESCPSFPVDEKEWEQERLIEILKKEKK